VLTAAEAHTVATVANHGLTTAQTSLIVAGISLVGIIMTAVLGSALGRWAEATNRRRTRYADAVATLVAWAEYPYRIRRRTSDDAAELASLRDLGHDLQERVRSHQTWIITENATVAQAYRQVWQRVSFKAGPASQDAWNHPPVTNAADMNLNGWGPDDPSDHIDLLQRVIAARFGYRRLIPGLPQWRARDVSGAPAAAGSGTMWGH
jgi:hypothetical protein